MSNFDIADLDFLEPGHIFVREDGREARLLFLTNTALPSKHKKNHPPQVVYADEENNVLSCSIDRFLNKRKFTHVDPELEARLNNLLALGSGSDSDSLDLDSDDELLVVDGDDSESSENDSEEGGEEVEGDLDEALAHMTNSTEVEAESDIDASGEPIVTFVPQNELDQLIDPNYLATLVSSYQESPNLVDGSIQHILFIRAAEGITKEKLYASFSPTHDSLNNTFTFNVKFGGQTLDVNWTSFAGVYSCVFYESDMFQIVFVESADRRAEANLAAAVAIAEATAPAAPEAPALEVAEVPAAPEAAPAPVVNAAPAAPAAPAAVVVKPAVVQAAVAAQ